MFVKSAVNPDIFLSGDVTRSSSVLYPEKKSMMQISRAL